MRLTRFRFRRTGGRSRRRRRIVAGAVVLAALAGVGTASVAVAHEPAAVHRENRFMTMPATPGSRQTVRIDTSFFTPAGGGRHPAVLLAHGFGGSKNDVTGQAEQLARHGYAVLTWSARGFGRSTGAIGLDAPDREVADVRRLVDWLGHRPDVLQDGPDDPRVGIAGASYGGAIALLAAGYDKRIDAIAPQITYWNLPDALFPQNAQGEPADSGVFKKLWAGIFFTTGSTGTPGGGQAAAGGGRRARNAPGRRLRPGGRRLEERRRVSTAPDTAAVPAASCRFTAQLCALYQRAAETGRADPAAVRLLDESSPSAVGGRITVPTLMVQGQNDSLFPLDQADAMARTIAANGAPVAVDWSSGGHDGGDQETARVDARIRDWFDRYLKHEPVNTGPAFRVTRQGGVDTTTGEVLQSGATDRPLPRAGRHQGRRDAARRAAAGHRQPGRRLAARHLGRSRDRRTGPTVGRGRGAVGRLPRAVGALPVRSAAHRAHPDRRAAGAGHRGVGRSGRRGGAVRQGVRRRARRPRDAAAPTRRATAGHRRGWRGPYGDRRTARR